MALAHTTPLQPVSQKFIIFSDLDGTLAHFPSTSKGTRSPITTETTNNYTLHTALLPPTSRTLVYTSDEGEKRECLVLPQSTIGEGIISYKTFEQIAGIRQHGHKFVIISGARKSTLLERLHGIPDADALVCEGGGRIYYRRNKNDFQEVKEEKFEEKYELDLGWAQNFVHVTGPIDTDIPPEKRKGSLWDLYRNLMELGFSCDTRSYTANFRVDLEKSRAQQQQRTIELVKEQLEQVASSYSDISCSSNLGKYDFYPSVSGKGNAVTYLISHFSKQQQSQQQQQQQGQQQSQEEGKQLYSIAMFDDDNDLSMAARVNHAFVVGITSQSVKQAIEENPSWVVSKKDSVVATEDILTQISFIIK